MFRKFCLLAVFLIFILAGVYAEECREGRGEGPARNIHQGFRGRSITMDISARIIENEEVVVWGESHQRVTMSGNPVSLKLVGSNVVVVVQFTPFIRPRGESVLVAQGQIWLEIPNQGIRYHTSIQTIPLQFDEPIFFFPLGTSQGGGAFENNAYIEVMVITKPYRGEGGAVFAERDGR